MKTIIPLLSVVALCGCTNLPKIVHESKDDPASWVIHYNGWGSTVEIQRNYPTNWTPTRLQVGGP